MTYEQQRDALAVEIETLRNTMRDALDAGRDVHALHEQLEEARQRIYALAMREHDFDYAATCSDLDAAIARVRALHQFQPAEHATRH